MQRTLFLTGSYESEYITFLRDTVGDEGVFIDVGANIGVHTVGVARGARAVYAFEPFQPCAAAIRRAVTSAGLAHRVTVECIALGARAETRMLSARDGYSHADTSVRSLYGNGADAVAVQVTTLDEWMESHAVTRVDAIKIDVEGAELEVLQGSVRVLTEHRPTVGVEVRADTSRLAGGGALETSSFLASLGYEPIGRYDHNIIFQRNMPLL